MATRYSPKTSTDGLVFMYDTGNSKSYKGEPTTNLLGVYQDLSAWGPRPAEDKTLTGETYKGLPVWRLEDANGVDPNTYVDNYMTRQFDGLTVGDTYTFSFYFRVIQKPTSKLNDADNSAWIWYVDSSDVIHWIDYDVNVWHRAELSGTVNSTWNRATPRIDYDNSIIDVCGLQFEKNSHATQFTTGTRSATEGLLDFTKNTTIDLSNISFDSNAKPDWDGTSDYIESTTPSDFRMGTNSFTLEAVAKQDVNTGHVLLEARGNSLIGYLWVVNHGTTGRMSLFYNDDSNQNIHYQTGDFNVSSTGVYYHLAVKVDRSENNIYFYINGEQAGNAVALQHTNSISPSSSDYYRVGWDRGGSPWNGEIAVFKHYNRALSAEEIKSNYNAIKGRFGI